MLNKDRKKDLAATAATARLTTKRLPGSSDNGACAGGFAPRIAKLFNFAVGDFARKWLGLVPRHISSGGQGAM